MRPRSKSKTLPVKVVSGMPVENDFAEIFSLIEQARRRAYQSVNTQLIDLYWTIGKFVRRKIDAAGWGKGTVKQLSVYIQHRIPGIRGFSPQNIWRMRQFYDAYCGEPKLSTLLRGLSWSANLHILSHSRQPESAATLAKGPKRGSRVS